MKHAFLLAALSALAGTVNAKANALTAHESAKLVAQFVEQFKNETSIARENLKLHEKRVALALELVQQGKTLKTSPTLALLVQKSRASADLQLSTVNLAFITPASWMIDAIEKDLSDAKNLPAAATKLQRVKAFIQTIQRQL